MEEKQELEKQVGAPIIGELGLMKRANEDDSPVIVGDGKQSIEAEQFRGLRTNLSYLGLHNQNKVVLVTSSMCQEKGKLMFR